MKKNTRIVNVTANNTAEQTKLYNALSVEGYYIISSASMGGFAHGGDVHFPYIQYILERKLKSNPEYAFMTITENPSEGYGDLIDALTRGFEIIASTPVLRYEGDLDVTRGETEIVYVLRLKT